MVEEGHPRRGGRKGDALDDNVVAYQQGTGHGSGGNDEVLKEKTHDKESDDEGGTERGQFLKAGTLLVFAMLCHE
jgi:hypothetical protein